MVRRITFCLLIFFFINVVLSGNKYSKEANTKKNAGEVDFRKLEKPFRMAKLNLLWTKAQHRLTEPKLKSLYSDLMIQDKEEIVHKRVKSEGGDKEGLKEAELRKKLTNIMGVYGLREHFDGTAPSKKEHLAFNEATDDHINRGLFKDKKLSMLWGKAEKSGFTSEELSALKEEFYHHQDKIDQYYDLLQDAEAGKKDQYQNALNDEEMIQTNEINNPDDEGKKDYLDRSNLIRDKHRGLRDGYDKLERLTARGRNNKEFVEPKVQGLWVMAAKSNFTVDELASLKVELHHYETRLLKLRHLQADHVASAGDKMDMFAEQQQMIKKHARKVEKMHTDIENRILERHTEL